MICYNFLITFGHVNYIFIIISYISFDYCVTHIIYFYTSMGVLISVKVNGPQPKLGGEKFQLWNGKVFVIFLKTG